MMQSELLGDLKVNAWQWLGKQQSGATQVILTPSKPFVLLNNPNYPSTCLSSVSEVLLLYHIHRAAI